MNSVGKLLNIGGDKDDRFYRYKMPPIISKIEGKGNGIKTVIPNMSDIGRALHRPSSYPTKFFGCELGAQVKCEEKNDRYIVNGAHDAQKLQLLLDSFIQKFVLCGSCGNPETVLIIDKDDFIIRDCKACGQRTNVDMRHKLTTHILKNPPSGQDGKNKKKGKKGKKNDSKSGPTPPDSDGAENSPEDSGDDELTREIQNAAKNTPPPEEVDDDDWAEDMSEEAVRRRQQELVAGVQGLGVSDDEEDPYDVFANYVTTESDASNAEILLKIDTLGLKTTNVLQMLPQVLFNSKILAERQISKRAGLFEKLAKDEKTQRALLGGFERLVGLQVRDLLPKITMILKTLYDEEIVEEEVFIAWGQKASKKYVGKRKIAEEILEKAKPFLDWLETAESEDSDDDDDDDDDEE